MGKRKLWGWGSGCLDGADRDELAKLAEHESGALGFAIGTAAEGQVGVPKGF